MLVAVVVIGFLLLVVGCADVLMRCVALRAVRFSSNQNHDLPGALPHLFKKNERKHAKHAIWDL